jgi:dTDP-4-dehydrorhamnose 3,5-epimerase
MNGVTITPLTKVNDGRGSIFHIMRSDDKEFTKFGEIYCSTIYPGIIKAWHLHKEMTLNYVVLKGMIKLVVSDGMHFEEIYMGDRNYCRVTIEPGIWNGFMAVGTEEAIVADLTDIPYKQGEMVRGAPDSLGYVWEVKNG